MTSITSLKPDHDLRKSGRPRKEVFVKSKINRGPAVQHSYLDCSTRRFTPLIVIDSSVTRNWQPPSDIAASTSNQVFLPTVFRKDPDRTCSSMGRTLRPKLAEPDNKTHDRKIYRHNPKTLPPTTDTTITLEPHLSDTAHLEILTGWNCEIGMYSY